MQTTSQHDTRAPGDLHAAVESAAASRLDALAGGRAGEACELAGQITRLLAELAPRDGRMYCTDEWSHPEVTSRLAGVEYREQHWAHCQLPAGHDRACLCWCGRPRPAVPAQTTPAI